MMRFVKSIFTLLTFFSFSITSLYAMQDGQATVTVTVEDDYTDEPVEAVLVRLLDNGSEIASGTTDMTGRVELVISVTSTEEPSDLIPESFQVSESYPNPFEQLSSVNLQIEEAQEVQAEIYNIIGQRVASLQVNLTPGTYTLQSSLGHLAQGVYFLRILGTQSQTIKMTKVGERIFSAGSILKINPATFVTRSGPGMAGLTLNSQTSRSLTLVTSNGSYDTYQQTLQVSSDTTVTVEMSRNNKVIIRVADENSPTQDVETSLLVEGDQFSQEITSPDTLTLKSGFYTLSADEANTAAFSQDIEIASEDRTVTVLTQVKTLADNQLLMLGEITDQATTDPISRAYLYVLNESMSDTLAGPLFAGNDGMVDEIINLNNGPDLNLTVLYRKDGYSHFDSSVNVSLPDTLTIDASMQAAPPPTASFTVTGDQTVGSPIKFNASSSAGASGESLTYSWDFGNGKNGGGESIGYVYSNSGSYAVTLTVVGEFGASAQITQTISITGLQPAGTATLSGTIFTNGGDELEGVLVSTENGNITGVSNPEGDVTLEGLDTGVPIVLTLVRRGYATQYVRTEIPAGTESAVFEANMLPRAATMTAQRIEVGGQFEGMDGVNVTLPVDGFVNEAGETVTGDLEMTFTPLDVREEGNLRAFPGSFSAVTTEGNQGELVTFGLAEYNFKQDGESVQLAPGKKATIEIPYYLDMNTEGNPVQAGDILPLWSLDETTGLWVEEGSGSVVASAESPTGFALQAEVTHFSWWNIDAVNDRYTAIAECKIIDNNGLPTLDIPDGGACFIRGVMGNGCTGRSVATTQIPAGTTVEIPLASDCNTTLFGSSSNGGSGNQTVSGSAGSTVSVTIPIEQTETGNQTLTVNDRVSDEVESDTDSYLLDPEENEFIVIEWDKLGNGVLDATLRVYDPENNLVDIITVNTNNSFLPFKQRSLLSVENPGLHRIELEHQSGNSLLYTLSIEPLKEINLNSPVNFSVIRGVSRYLYLIPDSDYVVRSEDGGILYEGNFDEFGDFSATGDSGGPLNLYSLRQGNVYVIEHRNINGPEVVQKEFTLEGLLRENLILETENILTLDLVESGETFQLDPEDNDFVIVEIDKSPGENITATLNLTGAGGTIIDTDVLESGALSNAYRARVVANITSGELLNITITPNSGSTGNYSIRTYAPETLALDQQSDFMVPAGGSYYHVFVPARDIVVRGSTNGSLLDNGLEELARMFEFSSAGRQPIIGRMLSEGVPYFIAQNNQYGTSSNVETVSRSFTLSEVIESQITFDGGLFTTTDDFASNVQAHVYTFEAEPNSGVVSILDESSINISNNGFYLAKIGNGTFYEFDEVIDDLTNRNSESRSILEATQRETYALVIQSSETGTYQTQIDIAEALESYTISPDLSCAGSTLRNVHAAALAAPENSSITLCEGLFEISSPIEIVNSGVSLVGTNSENSVIRGSEVYFMRVDGDDVSFRNLTIESSARTFTDSPSVYVDANNFTASGINMRPIAGQGYYDIGIEIRGDNASIEQSRFTNSGQGTALELSGTSGITIDNNEFLNQGYTIRSRDLSGNILITNNGFTYNEGSATPVALQLNFNQFDNEASTRTIESNTIQFENESSQVINTNQSPQQSINDIIRGNSISWMPRSANDAAILAEVGRETSSSLIEQNTIRTSGTKGGVGVRISPTNSLYDTGDITIRNNIITDTYRGIEVLYPDWFTTPVKIFNNSIRTNSPTFNNPLVGIRIVGFSNSENGPVQVQAVNNIFQGRSGQNDIGAEIYSGFQIDSDYNVFHQVGTAYSGGTTTTGTNDLTSDPLFINDQLELGSPSPAIDTGATSSEYNGIPDVDINGITRPQGSGVDRGAVESESQ